MTRIPLLAGSRLVVVTADDDAIVLQPPPPEDSVADVGAAVRDALRFPLAGDPLETLVSRGARATIVVEPPHLPLPGAERDPRQPAIAAAVAELERLGIPTGYQTLLVAGGLARRAGNEQLETLVSPEFARRFHGHVEVHDAEREDLVEIGSVGSISLRVHPALVRADVVVVVTAAETVLHGGPAALVGAAGTEVLRAAGAYSLLETSASQGWRLGLEIERALKRRVPVIGASLVLNHPRFGGTLGGYPYEAQALERVVRSPFRHLFRVLPELLRAYVLRSVPLERTVAAAFAGPPSVAHTEALLRGVELRGVTLDRQLDAICIGVPRTTPYLPRERPNPLLGAYLGRWQREARRSSSTTSRVTSRTPRSSPTAHSSRRRAPQALTTRRSPKPKLSPLPILARSRPTAPDAPSIHCCPSWTGTAAGPHLDSSAM
jgi:hypothetical protein